MTYFRSIGGSFGTAVFGSIFSDRLTANITHFLGALRLPAGVTSASLSPRALTELPPAVHHAFIVAYASSLQSVFRAAAPVAAVGFVLAWLLPEVKLRKTVAATDPGETFGMPTDRTSLQELERAVAVLVQHENRVAVYHRISVQAGWEGLRPGACCLLSRIGKRSGITVAELAEEIRTARSNLAPILDQLTNRGLVARSTDGDANISPLALTEVGEAALERMRAARGEDLADLLQGWSPDAHPELAARLQMLAAEFIDHDAQKLRTDDALRTAA